MLLSYFCQEQTAFKLSYRPQLQWYQPPEEKETKWFTFLLANPEILYLLLNSTQCEIDINTYLKEDTFGLRRFAVMVSTWASSKRRVFLGNTGKKKKKENLGEQDGKFAFFWLNKQKGKNPAVLQIFTLNMTLVISQLWFSNPTSWRQRKQTVCIIISQPAASPSSCFEW